MNLACISDVQLGYGSPQIAKLVDFLCTYYNTKGIVINPFDGKKKKIENISNEFTIRDIDVKEPYQPHGRTEYTTKAAKLVDEIKPDILVVCTTYSLPTLFQIKTRPKFVIYYYLETAMVYGNKDTEMNKKIGSLVDLVIFTEENRAVRFGEVCGFQNIPFCIIYNCVNNPEEDSIIPADKRNGKMIYQGTIRNDSCIDYYFDSKMQSIPIDIYGNIDQNEKEFYEKNMAMLHEDVHYMGYISSKDLAVLRKNYIYSIVIWKPVNENNLYASPNKLFESIASGIPPITAPHPQCKTLVNRYSCGIVINDWNFDSFLNGIKLAQYYYHEERDEYEKMVENCIKAAKEELNWQHQMKKLKIHLKDL
jgi:glycosyltransferase involved in cell wall biosynthesis